MLQKILSDNLIDREEFIEARNYLRETRLYNTNESFLYDKDYVLACACIEKLIPSIPSEQIPNVFNKIYYYKGLTWIQQRYVIESLRNTKISGDLEFLHNIADPKIYCTFHLGSYRMALFKLLEQGIDIAIIVATDTLKKQQESLFKAHQEMKQKYGLNNTLSYIEAESSTGVIQMVRVLKEGKSLFFYIDGNTGVGGNKRNDSKVVSVNFLNESLFTRRGIGYIAHKCNIPIIIGLCNYVSDEKMNITYSSPIIPDVSQDVNTSSKNITQSIYNIFTEALHQYPDQWEGWISLINMLDTKKIYDQYKKNVPIDFSQIYIFDKTRFSFFKYRGTWCMFDKRTFEIYPIQQELIDILNIHENFTLKQNLIPEDVFGFLIKNEIFITG